MPDDQALKRLGGGRWETRDGRFTIEPQSGTWAVVDNSQTDDLGLPLVRGPFGSLTAAKAAIEMARTAGPVESPLAARVKEASQEEGRKEQRTTPARARVPMPAKPSRPRREAPEEAPPPPEPKWLRDLGPADRRRAHELIRRLEKLGIAEPDKIARAEVAADRPAVTRLALERSVLKALASTGSPHAAARATIKVILSGRDAELGARWSLVDDRGRRLEDLDIPDPDAVESS
jgi:hypothetical protein